LKGAEKMNSQKERKEEMLKKKIWAVVGASHHKKNFGYKIYKTLKRFGYEVYPVNPGCETIDGDKVYPRVGDLPVVPECIDMVVKPEIGIRLLDSFKKAGIVHVWFQPGTIDEEIIKKAEEMGFEAVTEGCVMAELNGRANGVL
jgi:hypothetical protein